MKKLSYLMLAVLTACSLTLTSCGDDEPNNPGGSGNVPGNDNPYIPEDPINPVETTIVGVWRCVEKDETIEFEFSSDGSFVETEYTRVNGEETLETEVGSYYHDTREGRLRLNYYEEDGSVDTEYCFITLENSTMTLTDSDGYKMVFHRVAQSPSQKSILGSWSSRQGGEVITLTFRNDGTFTETFTLEGKPDSAETYTGTYVYDMTSGRLVMTYNEDGEVEIYTAGVAGDTLTLRSSDGVETYTKV